ncbi:hypothetical protein BDN72DRAFT_893501 [Pluteus cervinus]|uniref:Uncharacterized protein n=1 Tax=Pluteus cervinus TaxID=181527 RepID=A0ACD3B891_9AGAR|nr:hypothetical protein BDN72DRAFT_893501 [Pluteus cervinus]
MAFPSPVGGTFLFIDFIPSILFAGLYALLIPLIIYRAYDRTSRTTLLIGTVIFVIGHTVIYSLRAAAAHAGRTPGGLLTYIQADFTLGYVGISFDLVNLLRCLLVNSTFGSETQHQSPEIAARLSSRRYEPQYERLPEGAPDYPQRRFWIRRTCNFLTLGLFAATVPGLISTGHYSSDIRDPASADYIGRLRYASAGVTLLLTLVILGMTIWARALPRVNVRAAKLLSVLSSLICVIAIYRLSIMESTEDSLDSTAPGSQNRPIEKIMFYLFHVLPEWLVSFAFLGFNLRQMVGSGFFGDRRWNDETAEERAKREAKDEIRLVQRTKRTAQRQAKGRPVPVFTEYIPLDSLETIPVYAPYSHH